MAHYAVYNDEFATEGVEPRFYPSNHNTAALTFYPHKTILECLATNDERLKRSRVIRLGLDLVLYVQNKFPNHGLTVESGPIYYRVLKYSGAEGAKRVPIRKLDNICLIDMCWEAGIECLALEALGVENHHCLNSAIQDYLTSIKTDETLIRMFKPSLALRDQLEVHKHKIQEIIVKQKGKDFVTTTFDKLTFISNCSMTIGMIEGVSMLYLLSYDQFVMLSDTVISRSCSLMACAINGKTSRQFLPTFKTLQKIYNWGDELIGRYGLDAYSVLGEFESLCTRCMLNFRGEDTLNLSESYEMAIRENAKELEEELSIDPRWVDELFELLDQLPSINQISEIFGIRKHWGNPILDPAKSGRHVQMKAEENYPIKEDAVDRTFASFQRMITLEFIRKEGRWPACFFKMDHKSTPLARLHSKGSIRIIEDSPGHKREHWAGLIFKQNVVIDHCVTPLDLLSDKSCSMYKSHLDYTYVYSLRRDANKGLDVPEQRRILLEYMRRNHLSVEEIYQIVQEDKIPDEWLVNTCALKGTEMKHEKGRIFAVLCYELRQYFAATEEIIKRFIFPYNPHQTMTMKESELLKLLNKITSQLNPESSSEILYVLHIIDFSKWNLRMSDQNTKMIFQSIDNFLGRKNLIAATHTIFSKLINVVQDPFNPPIDGVLNTRSDTIWTGHMKGWEGQRQKGWTALTSALLSSIEAKTNTFSQIIGQGDNQVLCSQFKIPLKYKNASEWIAEEPDDIREKLDRFYDTLVTECEDMGLPVKKSESCRSLTFCNYGKRLYHCGVELSMELKRISRIATESNESYPTTENLCKTMTGASSAAPLYGPPSLTALIVGHFNVAMTLMRAIFQNPLSSDRVFEHLSFRGIRVNSQLLRYIMMIPGGLNGPHRTTIMNSFFRGHPDPLAADFSTITMSARAGSSYHLRLLTMIKNGSLINDQDETDLIRLIKSPFSLNVKSVRSPMGPLMSQVERALKDFCQNDEVKPLFTVSCSELEAELSEQLATMYPFHPTIANEIYMRSLPGRRDTFLSGFKHTTSFSRLLTSVQSDYYDKIVELEIAMVVEWAEFATRLMHADYDPEMVIDPHWVVLQNFREESWGFKIAGVTVPHPSEAVSITKTSYGFCSDSCKEYCPEKISVILLEEPRISSGSKDIQDRFAERIPGRKGYTGNVMEESMVGKTLKARNDSTALQDAIRLNTLRRWITEKGSKMDLLITNLIEMRTDLSLEQLDELSGVPIRLSFTHRAALMSASKSCSASCTTNLHTQIYLSSNTMGKFSRDDVNYSFAYGPTFLFSQHYLGLLMFYSGENYYSKKVGFHCHVYRDQIPVVYDGTVKLVGSSRPVKKTKYETCQLLFANSKDLVLEARGNTCVNLTFLSVEDTSPYIARRAYGVQILGDLFLKEEKLRELIGAVGLNISNPRDAPISVGDVSGIGIDIFIESLSNCLLLYLPWEVSISLAHDQGDFMLDTFLNGVGEKPWKVLATPFLTPKLLKSLVKYAPTGRSQGVGVQTDATANVLKRLVHKRMKIMMKELKEKLVIRSKVSPLLIMSDGKDSTRFLISRFCELCVALLVSVDPVKKSVKEKKRYHPVKEMIGKIHSFSTENHQQFIELVNSEFKKAQSEVLPTQRFSVPLPEPIIMDLNQDWAGRVRSIVEDEVGQVDDPYERKLLFKSLRFKWLETKQTLSCVFSEILVQVSSLSCSCRNFGPLLTPKFERIFMRSGMSSKDHYPLCEIIGSYKLSVKGVMSFGYSTGLELSALALLEENKILYFNPLISLAEFAPHCAGSFIPIEFVDNPHSNKLLDTAATLAGHEGGRHLTRIAPVLIQTEGHEWTGVFYKMRVEPKDIINSHLNTLYNVLRVAAKRLNSSGWITVEIPWTCSHFVTNCITLIGLLFRNVVLIKSSFKTYPYGNIFLLGYNVMEGFTERASVLPDVRVSSLGGEDFRNIQTFLDSSKQRTLPEISHLSLVRRQRKLSQIDRLSEDGSQVACCRYLPGWSFKPEKRKLAECIAALDGYISECQLVAKRIYDNKKRFFSQLPMTKGSRFLVEREGSSIQMNHTGFCLIRACLLRDVLKKPGIRSLNDMLEEIYIALMLDYNIDVDEAKIRIIYSFSDFINENLGDLLEILGVLFRDQLDLSQFRFLAKDLHFAGTQVHSQGLNSLNQMSIHPASASPYNPKWKWKDLSDLLFVIFSSQQAGYEEKFVVNRSESFMRLICRKVKIKTTMFVSSNDTFTSRPLYILFGDEYVEGLVLEGLLLLGDIFCVISREASIKYHGQGFLNSVYRPVFRGLCPGDCWALLSQHGGYEERPDRDVSWAGTDRLWPVNVDSSCRCRDCSAADLILKRQSIKQGLFKLITKYVLKDDMETVFDLYHC